MVGIDDIRNAVARRMPDRVVDELIQLVVDASPRLWGEQKPRHFIAGNVLLTLYKDLYGVSYDFLVENVRLGFRISKFSLLHNVPIIRFLLAEWGHVKTPVGMNADWNRSVRHVQLPQSFQVSRTRLHL